MTTFLLEWSEFKSCRLSIHRMQIYGSVFVLSTDILIQHYSMQTHIVCNDCMVRTALHMVIACTCTVWDSLQCCEVRYKSKETYSLARDCLRDRAIIVRD